MGPGGGIMGPGTGGPPSSPGPALEPRGPWGPIMGPGRGPSGPPGPGGRIGPFISLKNGAGPLGLQRDNKKFT